MLDEALEAIKSEIEFILDELDRINRKLLGQPQLATEGIPTRVVPDQRSFESPQRNKPNRMTGSSSGGLTPDQQRLIDTLDSGTFTKLKADLTSKEISEFIKDLGPDKVKELADKFGGDVMKHYGHAFFKSYKGVTDDTMNHLLQNDGIVKGQIKGCHDADMFYIDTPTAKSTLDS